MRADKRNSRNLRLKLLSAAVMSCFASAGLANPTGPIAPPPGVNISGVGTSAVMIQNTTGTNQVINWQGFSIDANELTQFTGFVDRAALNRVMVLDPANVSNILGTLRSDGRVFLINPNGITIGAGALLDLPGFVASTLDMSDGDFMAGRMNFNAVPDTAGTVQNYANLSMPAGGSVYLVGHAVTNHGLISTPQGETVLAAGQSVEIVNPGTPGLSVVMSAPGNQALNMGQIFADSGQVGMFGGLVTQQGMVSANSVIAGADGSIKLVATDAATFTAGSSTMGGGLDVQAGSLLVQGNVQTGPQTIQTSGGVVVQNGQLNAVGGQSIEAAFVEVSAIGGFAGILNADGEQSITTQGANAQGEGIAVRGTAGGFAFLDSIAGNQRVELRNSDRLTVDGSSGHAQMIVVDGGQTITATGTGGNAIELGASGGAGGSFITSGGGQTLVAGAPGEHGSITVQGANARISTLPGTGGAQTISATGTVAVLGGSSPGGSSAGFFHNGSGVQTIQAGELALQGGAGGANNSAQVNSAIGPQVIDVGSLTVSGGSAGTNNFAFVRAQGAPQAIHAGALTLQAGAGGTSNFAAILGAQQTIMVDGDATISGGASLSTPTLGGGALIGGGTSLPTDLVLTAGGSVTLNGGAIPGSGASLGASNAGTQPTEIHVQVDGDVNMNPGTGTGTRMGAAPGNSRGGSIQVQAGGRIYLGSAGPDIDAVIRTSEDVSLTAQQITQDPDAKIEAASLTVHTQQGALLGGTNAVDQFNAVNDFFGDVALRNASPLLTLTSLQNFGGGFNLQQTGDALVNGFVISGPQAVDVAGTLTVRPGATGAAQLIGNVSQTVAANAIVVEGGSAGVGSSAAIVAGSGPQTINAGAGGIVVKGGAAGTNNFAMIHQGDALASQTVTSTGPVLLEGGGGTFNFALVRSFGTNQSLTFGDTTVLAGAGGVDNFATVQGLHQDMTVHGDLSVVARGSDGTLSFGGGARIGGPGGPFSSSTDLALQVNGNLTMTAGDVSGTGVSLGGHLPGDLPAVISANVSGNVTLNGGTAPDTIARIGSADSGATGGNVALTAGGNIALNSSGPGRYSVIRTLDGVTLTAQKITQGADARIEAGSLTVQTSEGASLVGMNAVDMFNASNWASGNVELNNASPLLTVVNVINPIGAVSLQQAGDMRVAGDVASGVQSVDVTGDLVVQNEPGSFAQLGAQGGQTIHAGSVEVNGVAGGSASIFNFGGAQHIVTTASNTAGEGLAVRAADDGFAAISAPVGPQTIEVRDADRVVIDAASGFARIEGTGGPQSISLTGAGDNQFVLGSPGARFQSIIVANDQTIVAGGAGENGGITVHGTDDSSFGTALILTLNAPGGTQSVSTSGALQVFGGSAPANSATGIFANGFGGQQTIYANSILLQGGEFGFGNSAMIGANSGSQSIEAGLGGITLRGGATGRNNFAMINQASTDPAASQTITSAGPVLLEGGSGNFNFAMIRAFGGHQGLEFGDTTLLAGATGIDNFSVIQAREQDVTVHGDLELRSRASGGSPEIGGGSRIGGLGGGAPTPTSLRLNVDGNFTMTGGDLAGTGVILGNTTTFAGDTDIDVTVGGNVSMNGGSVPGTFAVIGSRAGLPGGGSIRVAADGEIALNSSGPEQASIIRTLEDVTLVARSITQGPDSFIEAGSLTVQTADGASLTGMNALDVFSGSNWASGGIALNNASPLLTIVEVINPIGEVSLQQTGDMRVIGSVASGVQTVDVTGGLVVQNEPGSFAQLGAQGGQTIHAGYVEVNARAGGSASIFNFGGPQHISTASTNAAGEGLAVRASDGGFARIGSLGGPQTIEVHDADRAVVQGMSGSAGIDGFGGPQTISMTGGGANALELEGAGGSFISSGGTQTIRAGGPGESGSIRLQGPNARMTTAPVAAGTQTVSAIGAIEVLGGSIPGGSSAGIFHAGTGAQSIAAGTLIVQGGSGGSFNTAQVNSANGVQMIDVGSVSVNGGSDGINNFAFIRAQAAPQSIHAGELRLNAGTGGAANFAGIFGAEQYVTVDGDATLSGGATRTTATFGGGALMGGATSLPTNLTLTVGGDLNMNGGAVPGSGASLGASNAGVHRTDIRVQVDGDVNMNPGTGTGTRMGAAPGNSLGGFIQVQAGGRIYLGSAGPDRDAVIRTSENVSLIAQQITQDPDAKIEAASLTVQTADGASLTGMNAVERLTMSNSVSGGVDFHNASALLTVGGIDQVSSGALNVDQDGNLRVIGDVTSGSQSISASGDMTVAAGDGPGVTVQAFGPQAFNVGGSFSLLGGTAADGFAQTLASGPVAVTTGGDLNVRGGDGLYAYARMYAGQSMHLSVGNELHVDGGSGLFAFARVQTEFWEKIFLDFPNASGGSYFVDGREGASSHGLNGLFNGFAPARPGRGLILSYGL